MTTLDFLLVTSSLCPQRTAVVFEGKRVSYATLENRSRRLANALRGLGVGPGDRVATIQTNCPQVLEAYYATALLGGVFAPLNFRTRQEELAYLLQHSEARVLLLGERYGELVNSVVPQATGLKHRICLDKPLPGMLYYEDLVFLSPEAEAHPGPDEKDVTLLLYTAGTTGRPKGVPLTHDSFATYMTGNVNPAEPEPARVEANLLSVPLYHVAGFQAMLAAIYGGRTLVIMGAFEAEDWLRTVQEERVSRAMLVPTMLKRILDHPHFSRYDLSSLQLVTYGAASMPLEVIRQAIQRLPEVKFINAFGQTETSSTILALGPEDHQLTGSPQEIEKKLQRLASSIGRPLPGVEVVVLDEHGHSLPPGHVGEICARGPRVMAGYWKDPEKTARQMTATGWLRTGDLGRQDEEGYFYLAGRGDDMIIRGGENISPEEVEQALQAHPRVEEAAVIGVPDPEWGQQPRAVVVLKPGPPPAEAELIEFCRGRLSSFKCPRSVIFVPSLPRNPLGKVLRKALREQHGSPPGQELKGIARP